MRATRRLVLAFLVMGAALTLASGVALAANLVGTEGDDTLKGTLAADYLDGRGGNDTISEGPTEDGDALPDTLVGGSGDDFINAASKPGYAGPAAYPDYIYCNEGFDRVWGNYQDQVYNFSPQTGPGCEVILGIFSRTGTRITGAYSEGSKQVEFDSYVVNGMGDEPGGKPYDKETVSYITINRGFQVVLTVNPKNKTIKQRVNTAANTLSEADRRALKGAANELSEFLDRKGRGDCNMKNQETLVLRHFALVLDSSKDQEFDNFERRYTDPEDRCNSNQNTSAEGEPSVGVTDSPAKGIANVGLANVSTEGVLGAEAKHCPANTAGGTGLDEAKLAGFSGRTEPTGLTQGQYVPLQSAGDDGITYLPCGSGTETGYFTYADGTPDSSTGYGPASSEQPGTCGPSNSFFLEFAYTQDCLDHDICVQEAGGSATFDNPDCNDEFDAAVDDTLFTAGLAAGGLDYVNCDPFSSTVAGRPPGTGGLSPPVPGGTSFLKKA